MTDDEADAFQDWLSLDGATAWHLIERHADNWQEVGAMMDAWLRAHVAKMDARSGIGDQEAKQEKVTT